MATPYQIKISPEQTGLLRIDQTAEAADKATEFLQKDLQEHHVFFNKSGFHNHIVHQILTLFGTGANPSDLAAGHDANTNYQRPAKPGRPSVADDLSNWDTAQKHLGDESYYADFLLFYQREIERLGSWQEALKRHLFNRHDPRAEDLFQRMFAGFLHPLIQLLYGVEWDQPAVVAEAMAQAAVHGNRLAGFLVEAEKRGEERRRADAGYEMPPILDLIGEAGGNKTLGMAAEWRDDNKIYDGVLVRAPQEAIELTSKVWVRPDELDERTAEMFHAAVYVALGAAVRAGKEPRVDFYLMHHVNAAPIHLIINSWDWLPIEYKVRILEYKIRLDIVQYAARRCPPILFDEAASNEPRDRDLVARTIDLLPRFHRIIDDGHTIKLARVIHLCRDLMHKYGDKPWLRIKSEEQWVHLSYLVLDAAEKPAGVRWARSAGFDEAWKEIPDKK